MKTITYTFFKEEKPTQILVFSNGEALIAPKEIDLNAALRQDREIVLDAVKSDGLNLEAADEKLQGDREIVLAAVKSNGNAFEFADEKLQGDREIVIEALWSRYEWGDYQGVYPYVSRELMTSTEFILDAIKEFGSEILDYVSMNLLNDLDFMKEAAKRDVNSLDFIESEEFWDDPEIREIGGLDE